MTPIITTTPDPIPDPIPGCERQHLDTLTIPKAIDWIVGGVAVVFGATSELHERLEVCRELIHADVPSIEELVQQHRDEMDQLRRQNRERIAELEADVARLEKMNK